jgi:2-methylcitrate dehydratase PrpD
MTSTVEQIAAWAHGIDDAPEEVLALARAQRRSVLGAIAGSSNDVASRRVLDALAADAPDGAAPLVGTAKRTRAEEAIYAACALSIALDFDDYVCFGHTGHSAVLVPLMLSAETRADGRAQLLAQVAANEVEARLGGACLIGPLNGQLWSFIHAAGAAIAAGRVLGLDRERLAHALAIALYQAPRPTVPGFMAPDSKLLTASEPSMIGVRAARLAARGVTGPLDALDHAHGFLSAFAFAPMSRMLERGDGWATRTLCVKPYPGCAYIDTTLDALFSLGPIEAGAIERIDVAASLLTCGMNGLSKPYAGGAPTPVTVTFSIPWNVAIGILAREVGPDQVDAAWLTEHRRELSSIVSKVHLTHDAALTRKSIDGFLPVLAPRAMLAPIPRATLLRGLAAMRREHTSISLGLRDARALMGLLAGDAQPWSDAALRSFEMRFPARVRVALKSGRVLEAEASIPRGGAGHLVEGPIAIAKHKLATLGPRLYRDTAALDRAIEEDRDLLPLLA